MELIVGIFSRIKKSFIPKEDHLSTTFANLPGFSKEHSGWLLTDASGNHWRFKTKNSEFVPLDKYYPKDRGTLYVDLSIQENKNFAVYLMMKTIEVEIHPNEEDTKYVTDAKCSVTGIEIKNSEKSLFQTLFEIVEARGFLFCPEVSEPS
jgi:hypothetical protein